MRSILLSLFFVSAPALAGGNPTAGGAVYQANCSICHGAAADGSGAAGAAMSPKPVDFTSAEWWAGQTDSSVAAMIKNGKPGTPMTGFGFLGDAKIDDIVAFLNTKKPQ
jgi:mono/diheme cytochrome c family protein